MDVFVRALVRSTRRPFFPIFSRCPRGYLRCIEICWAGQTARLARTGRTAPDLSHRCYMGRPFYFCVSVIQRLKSSVRDQSMVGSIISDIKAICYALSSVSFMHVRRHRVVLAHVLARSSLSSLSLCVYNSALDCIRETLCNMFA